MSPLSPQTARLIDEELAGIGFHPSEIEKIASQVEAWSEEIQALDELDLSEVEPALIYAPEER